jgi:hypothetical protein
MRIKKRAVRFEHLPCRLRSAQSCVIASLLLLIVKALIYASQLSALHLTNLYIGSLKCLCEDRNYCVEAGWVLLVSPRFWNELSKRTIPPLVRNRGEIELRSEQCNLLFIFNVIVR